MDNTMTQLAHPDCKIESVNVIDLRVPTSDTLLGSDPFSQKTKLFRSANNY